MLDASAAQQQTGSSLPSPAFVYANETNRVLKSSARFTLWTRAPRLSHAVLPKAAMQAWHRTFVRLLHCETAAHVVGEWTVWGVRSDARRVFRFSAANPRDAAWAVLPAVEDEVDKLVRTKFPNVVMM